MSPFISMNGGSSGGTTAAIDVAIIQEMLDFSQFKTTEDPDTVLTATGASALQTSVDAANDGDIIEVNTDAVYNPITLPVDIGLTIRSTVGRSPKITGQHGILISDGARDIVISGFTFPGCSTINSNWKGAAVALEHQGKFENVILHRCAFPEVNNGSAIMISYHQSISGDNYATSPTYPDDFSTKFGVIDCDFFHACKDGIEGAAINLRAVEWALIHGCRVNGNNVGGRGVQLQVCKNIVVIGNTLFNFASNGEGIKLDRIGSTTELTTGFVLNNHIYNSVEGIDVDDYAAAFIQNNLVHNCSTEGISVDGDGGSATIIGNVVHDCVDGIRAEANSVVELRNNCSFNNSSNNYRMDNGYSPDASNLTVRKNIGPSAVLLPYNPTTSGDWNSIPDNIKSALDELANRVSALEP